MRFGKKKRSYFQTEIGTRPRASELPPISPEAEAALPVFLEMLREATDEEWPQDIIEQRAAVLARAPAECPAACRGRRLRVDNPRA